ncbi:unnamed protein product [Effrenium voratum]|nr:unnamed protein product [Effrenium voratum]
MCRFPMSYAWKSEPRCTLQTALALRGHDLHQVLVFLVGSFPSMQPTEHVCFRTNPATDHKQKPLFHPCFPSQFFTCPGLLPSLRVEKDQVLEDHTAHVAALAAEFGERLVLAAVEEVEPSVALRSEPFEVVRKPMVAVRSQPSTEGLIVVSVEFGRRVDTFGLDSSGVWRRVFCKCTQTAKQEAPLPDAPLEAWIMEEHPSLGQLLRPLDQ